MSLIHLHVEFFLIYLFFVCLYSKYKSIVNVFKALHWILSPEAPVPPIPLVEDLLLSEDCLHADDQEHMLRKQLKITDDIIATTVERQRDRELMHFGPY